MLLAAVAASHSCVRAIRSGVRDRTAVEARAGGVATPIAAPAAAAPVAASAIAAATTTASTSVAVARLQLRHPHEGICGEVASRELSAHLSEVVEVMVGHDPEQPTSDGRRRCWQRIEV